MKNKVFIFLVTVFLLVIFFTQFKLVNHPIADNDEGIYSTSFLLVNKGYSAYKETYFSQPPGFLLTVYPGFVLLGKTLQSARFTIGIWAIIGLLTIIWIFYELKNKWAGLLAISLLSLIPSYYNQAITFQSDILITTFSLLSLVTLIKYGKSLRLYWFIISIFFLNLAFWTKFDITMVPAYFIFLFLLFNNKKINFRDILNLFLISFVSSLAFFILFISPFGIREVFSNSIILRFQAAQSSPFSLILFNYLKKDFVLSLIIIGSLILSIFKKDRIKYPLNVVLTWAIFVLIIFFFYRPLFPHHLVILAVPMVLLFSQIIDKYFKNKKIFKITVVTILSISLLNRIYMTSITSQKLINDQQENAVEIIKQYTNTNDFVICDEEILNAISGRLPPPELSDVSQVRIRSNNLTSEDFIKIVNTYKPKLIITWNGRLQSIKNFNEAVIDYKILNIISESKKIYIRIK